jgi:hypothetical protein
MSRDNEPSAQEIQEALDLVATISDPVIVEWSTDAIIFVQALTKLGAHPTTALQTYSWRTRKPLVEGQE